MGRHLAGLVTIICTTVSIKLKGESHEFTDKDTFSLGYMLKWILYTKRHSTGMEEQNKIDVEFLCMDKINSRKRFDCHSFSRPPQSRNNNQTSNIFVFSFPLAKFTYYVLMLTSSPHSSSSYDPLLLLLCLPCNKWFDEEGRVVGLGFVMMVTMTVSVWNVK